MGYMSIPVILIDGEHVLGFDLNRIESLLENKLKELVVDEFLKYVLH